MLSFFRKHKAVTIVVGLVILSGGWYLFRPEKLFINQKVNEAAPFQVTNEAQPVSTGTLTGKLHDTSGRATVYRETDGTLTLRLTNFHTSNGPDVHVVLATADDPALKSTTPGKALNALEVGALKGNEGDQSYKLPEHTDLAHYSTVAIYCERIKAVFGTAHLEAF
jgi:Electron transfer DM13